MYKKSKRFLAGFLAFLLVVTMLPADMLKVYAEETENVETQTDEPQEAELVSEDAVLGDSEVKTEDTEIDASIVDDNKEEDDVLVDSDVEVDSDEPKEEEVVEVEENTDEVKESVITRQENTEEKYDKEIDNQSTVTISDVLDIGEAIKEKALEPKEYSENVTVGRYTLLVAAKKAMTIETCTVGDYGGRIKTSGKGTKDSRCISFQAEVGETITAYFQTGSSGKARTLILSDGTTELKSESNSTTGTPTKLEFIVTTAGEYYLYGGDNIQIFYVSLSKEVETTDISGATVELSETTKTYTGEDIKPTLTVKLDDKILTVNNDYTLMYARGTGDDGKTAPETSDYIEAENFDFKSTGTIFVKVIGTRLYEGELDAVSYEIVKGVAPTVASYPCVADISRATEEEKNNDSISHTIDLNKVFTIESKYGTATFKNARIEDGSTANNVLAATPNIQLSDSSLSFCTKATVPTDGQVKATIKVDAEFENYETATLVLEVTLAEKKTVTIEGITVEKTYDGTAVEPSIADLVIKEGTQEITDEALKSSLVYTYAVEDGEVLEEAPKDAGAYTLTVSIPSDNRLYTGESEAISFTIKKAVLTITAKDRKWGLGYPGLNDFKVGDKDKDTYGAWYEVSGLVGDDTTAGWGLAVQYEYKDGDNAVDWTTATANSEIKIVPSVEASGISDNYEFRAPAVAGTVVIVEDTVVTDAANGVYVFNPTKDWHTAKYTEENKDYTVMRYGNDDAKTDGYFTVSDKTGFKTAGSGNSYPLIAYEQYGFPVKVNGDAIITFTTTKPNTQVEVLAHIANGSGLKLYKTSDSKKANISGFSPTVLKDGDSEISGQLVPIYAEYDANTNKGYNPEGQHQKIYKATITLPDTAEYAIARNGSSESQLYYIKVTEPIKTTVTVTPTITGLPDGAKIAFKPAEGEAVVLSGATVELQPSTTYTVIVQNADGSAPQTATVKVGTTDSNIYTTGTADSPITITVTSTSGGDTTDYNITLTTTVANATVTAGTKTTAKAGDEVKLSDVATVTPASGYKLSGWTVTKGTDPVTVTEDATNGYVFTMPAGAVTVTPVIVEEGSNPNPPTPTTPDKPTASEPNESALASGTKVTLSAATGTDIYYIKSTTAIPETTVVDATTGTPYTNAGIVITEETYIKAVAIKDNAASDPLNLHYTILAADESATPKADPQPGPVEKGTQVTLSAAAGAKIYYTTDSTEPTEQNEYKEPITINETTIIKAYAVEDGKKPSKVLEFAYTVKGGEEPGPGPDDPTPTVKPIKLSDCTITVPTIINTPKLGAKQPSTTYVTYAYEVKYADGTKEQKSVKFAEGIDYTVEWNGKVDGNTYSVTLTGAGRDATGRSVDGYIIDSTSIETVKYDVIPKPVKGAKVVDISKAKINLTLKTADYTGYPIEPKADFSKDKTGLKTKIENRLHYTYKNNINTGKATVTISVGPATTEAENADETVYVGSKTLTFNIKKATLNATAAKATAKVDCTVDATGYTGTPTITVRAGKNGNGKAFTEGIDYTVTSKLNAKKKEVAITVKGIGSNLSGSWKKTSKIAPLDVKKLTIDPAAQTVVYSPKGGKLTKITASITEDGNKTDYILTEGVDYTAKYTYKDSKNKKAGSTVDVVITGKNGCIGSNEIKGIEIAKANFNSCIKVPADIVVDSASKKSVADDLKKSVTVTDVAGVKFKIDKDYTLTVNTENSTVTIVPKDKTNYEEAGLTVKYRKAKNLAKEKAFAFKNSKKELLYDGRNPVEITQAVITENIGTAYILEGPNANIEIVPGTYKNNAKKGSGSVTIRGKAGVEGGFYGTKVLKFKIAER